MEIKVEIKLTNVDKNISVKSETTVKELNKLACVIDSPIQILYNQTFTTLNKKSAISDLSKNNFIKQLNLDQKFIYNECSMWFDKKNNYVISLSTFNRFYLYKNDDSQQSMIKICELNDYNHLIAYYILVVDDESA